LVINFLCYTSDNLDHKNGTPIPLWLHITAVVNHDEHIVHYVGIVSDLSQRKEAEEKLSLDFLKECKRNFA
jgi:PAS domain S-box-containing protein